MFRNILLIYKIYIYIFIYIYICSVNEELICVDELFRNIKNFDDFYLFLILLFLKMLFGCVTEWSLTIEVLLLWCFLCYLMLVTENYASTSSGDVYSDQQLTTNFEL